MHRCDLDVYRIYALLTRHCEAIDVPKFQDVCGALPATHIRLGEGGWQVPNRNAIRRVPLTLMGVKCLHLCTATCFLPFSTQTTHESAVRDMASCDAADDESYSIDPSAPLQHCIVCCTSIPPDQRVGVARS